MLTLGSSVIKLKMRGIYMKKMNWLIGAVLSIVGLLVLIFPAACVKVIAVLLGLGAVAYGIFTLIDSKKIFSDSSFFKTAAFVKGISSIVLGLLTMILPLAVASTAWKVMVYIFAVYLILVAGFGFYTVSVLKDTIGDRKHAILENLSLLVAGVLLILISPQKLGLVIIRIIGIAALVVGVIILAIQIIGMINKKKSEIVVEAEVKDDVAEPSENTDTSSESAE